MSVEPLNSRIVDWVTAQLGAGTRISSADGLRMGTNPWLIRYETNRRSGRAVLRLGGDGIATEVAALRLAQQTALPAPAVLAADTTGMATGQPAVLMTVVEGSSKIPTTASAKRLRTMGEIAAKIGLIATEATDHLPRRNRPISLEDFEDDRRMHDAPSSALLNAAAEEIANRPVPVADRKVLVHGDFWQGNMLFRSDDSASMIDWDMAGVGHPFLDLGSARLDAAIMFGQHAAAEVRLGWESTAGRTAEHIAYWDIVAALSTPADFELWRPQIHAQGRADLPSNTMSQRRDAFLRVAISEL